MSATCPVAVASQNHTPEVPGINGPVVLRVFPQLLSLLRGSGPVGT